MDQNNDTPDLQSVLDKWLAFAREEAKRQAAGQTNTTPSVPPVPPAPPVPPTEPKPAPAPAPEPTPETAQAPKRKPKLGVILLAVLLALSLAGNVYLYSDRQNLVKRYGKLLDDYDTMEQRAQTYRAFYDSAKSIMSDRNFEKAKDAAEKKIKDETLWAFNPKWGY